ncbi:MAG: sulfite exporter TauE/SafE family protein, partial [Arenimonas sp.]
LLPAQGVPPAIAMQAALATSLASVIVTAAASAQAHARRGAVLWRSVAWLLPGLLLGAWLGGRFATGIDGATLRWFVIGYCLLAALQLLLDYPRAAAGTASDAAPTGPWLSGVGTLIGAISAVVGIGGGSMTVPVLVSRGVAPVRAVATSSACGVAIGLSAAASYASAPGAQGMPAASLGYVFLPAAIGIVLTSLPMAPFGARLAHRLAAATLKRIFAGFLVAMALLLAL